MIRVDDIEQGTEQWMALKAGIPSASSFSKIITAKKMERAKPAEKYLNQLAAERITGIRQEGFQSKAMTNGIETEEEAVNAYELLKNVDTEKVAVVYKDEEKKVLCSPDRFVVGKPEGSMDGLLEIKCPLDYTHVQYILTPKKLESEYFQQVQGQLFVTGLDWCDLMSYFPGLQPVVVRVNRDKIFLVALELELKLFCAELEEVVEQIK